MDLKSLKVSELFDLEETSASVLFESVDYPWEVLSSIANFIMKLGRELSKDDFDYISGDVWISKTAKIAPTASIQGPTIIGHFTEVRHCAYIRGKVLIGDYCVIGNSTEVKNSVLFNKVQVPHFNYVGDSVLGYQTHLGAGVITSNVKSDKSNVTVNMENGRYETGIRKFGAILGDGVDVGCNSVLNPGTVIGRNTNVYPLSMVRSYIPPESIYKKHGDIVDKY